LCATGSPQQIKWLVDLQRVTTSPQNAVRICNACDDIGVVELLPKMQVPTLVLRCCHDNVAPGEQGERDLPRGVRLSGVRLSRKHAPRRPRLALAVRRARPTNPRARPNRYAAATRSASFLRA
jgi:hypothetical protein